MLAELLYWLKRPVHIIKTGLFNGLPAMIRNGFPQRKLQILAITGTDGKTTSATMLYHVLKSAGYKVGLISTVAAYIGDRQFDTGFHVTAPLPSQVFSFMREMVREGCTHLVIETTSHGIYQSRTWGWRPNLAGLTNIAHEHLDYHLTYERYVAAKALLLKSATVAVINADDQSHAKVRKELRGNAAQVVEYSVQDTLPKVVAQAIDDRFLEPYNHSNARLVYALASRVGVTPEQAAAGFATFTAVPGRMERVPNKKGLDIVIDFAHTPQGLENALTALQMQKKQSKSKIIAVFGCASERDRGKRPMMTAIACDLADYVILTAEDPRQEDIWSIIREMKEQLTTGHNKILTIADRQMAITFAITELAKKGDIVGIFGKGHEASMCIGTTEYPWSDLGAVKRALGEASTTS